MKAWRIFILLAVFLSSCRENPSINGVEVFGAELSDEAVSKIAENNPFSLSDRVALNKRNYTHYELFGHSGIAVQYNVSEDNEVDFTTNLEQYQFLPGESIAYKDSSNIYIFREDGNDIKIPELSYEFGNFADEKINNSEQVDVYLIEKGKLSNVFIKEVNKDYKYTIGIYNFKNRSTVFYWFLVYEDDNRNEENRTRSTVSTVGNNI